MTNYILSTLYLQNVNPFFVLYQCQTFFYYLILINIQLDKATNGSRDIHLSLSYNQKNKTKSSIKLTRCILNRSNHFITAHVCCAMVNNDNTMTIWICASFSLLSACPWWMAIRPIAYEFVEKIENFVEHSLLFAYLPVFDS